MAPGWSHTAVALADVENIDEAQRLHGFAQRVTRQAELGGQVSLAR
jgi:hypothetical protein